MSWTRIAWIVLPLAVALPRTAAAAEIEWQTNLRPALRESAATGKPLLVDVWAVWCVPCKQMDETTYRDPEVVRAVEEFIPLKVDHDLQELFVERYDVEALPLVLVLDVEGREISRLAGLVQSEPLISMMASVKRGYSEYLKAMEQPKAPRSLETVGDYLLRAGNPGQAERTFRQLLKQLKGRPAAETQPVELKLARSQLAAEELKPAAAIFERLSTGGEDPAIRGQALEGLARLQQQRDGEVSAATLEQLRREFPELAAGLTVTSDDGS